MQKQLFILLPAASLIMLSSCSKLGALSADNFKVEPTPLETQGSQVPATINGMFPEKYMKRKAVVSVTPELRYGNGKVARGNSATFQGEKVLGNDQTISYALGGHYTMKTSFAYTPEMQTSDLYLTFNARMGKKQVEIPAVKVGYGVIATSQLYRRTVAQSQACLAPDSFKRVVEQKQDANIKFLIQQAQLRKSELKNNSVGEFVSLLKKINKDHEGYNINSVQVNAYASPDGGVKLNDKLANQRQKNSEKYVRQQLKSTKTDAPVDAAYTAQDWDGFQELVSASNIQDKDVILRVLSMYKDPQEREQQIKNMSAGFRELADGILPQLRRARLTINYETIGRDDDQIKQQYQADPSKLSLEEMLYSATLTDDAAQQQSIYEKTAEMYPNDCRAYNNLATLAYQRGDYSAARSYIQKAQAINPKNAESFANLGMLALQQGDVDTAEGYISKAAGANNLDEALGNLHLAQGQYALACQDFRHIDTNSAALAQILNKDYAKAASTLKNVAHPNGTTDYLQAILNARQGSRDAAAASLRSALQKDPSLQNYAARDLELSNVNK